MSPNIHFCALSAVIISTMFITGCSVHTINREPAPLLTSPTGYSATSVTGDMPDELWWAPFNDNDLDELIHMALDNNLDILVALARLRQATALTRQAETRHLPTVDLIAGSEQRWWEGGEREDSSRIGAAFSWEADVFQRLDSAALARKYEELAQLEFVAAVRLRLSAEVAEAYFDAVEQRNQLVLLNRQIELDQDLLELTTLRYNSGLTSSVDMLQQSSQLAEAKSLIPVVETALRVAENRLDVLIGTAPDDQYRVAAKTQLIDTGTLPFIGVPADLLFKRPDIRALRNELVAADAEIGSAIAERFPKIILNGSLLYEGGVSPGGLAFSLFGSFIQPLIDWGARKAEIERNRALYVERLAFFTQRFLEAVEDVENALYGERKQREFLHRLAVQQNFLERSVEKTTERYTNGLTDYLPVLDAIKSLSRLQRIIVRQERVLLEYRIQLHRALGGSLPPFSPEGYIYEEYFR